MGVKEFQITKECMVTDDTIATLNTKGHSTIAKQRIWDKDIFGPPLEEANTSEVSIFSRMLLIMQLNGMMSPVGPNSLISE